MMNGQGLKRFFALASLCTMLTNDALSDQNYKIHDYAGPAVIVDEAEIPIMRVGLAEMNVYGAFKHLSVVVEQYDPDEKDYYVAMTIHGFDGVIGKIDEEFKFLVYHDRIFGMQLRGAVFSNFKKGTDHLFPLGPKREYTINQWRHYYPLYAANENDIMLRLAKGLIWARQFNNECKAYIPYSFSSLKHPQNSNSFAYSFLEIMGLTDYLPDQIGGMLYPGYGNKITIDNKFQDDIQESNLEDKMAQGTLKRHLFTLSMQVTQQKIKAPCNREVFDANQRKGNPILSGLGFMTP